ncbi:hypothetical protein SCUP515_05167 [Seiridium cupressi]
MTKIIASAAVSLAKESARCRDLELKVSSLQKELTDIKARLAKYEVLPSKAADVQENVPDGPAVKKQPSYMQSTVTSHNRSVNYNHKEPLPPTKQHQRTEHTPTFDDGKLLVKTCHYHNQTLSSINKVKPKYRPENQDWNDWSGVDPDEYQGWEGEGWEGQGWEGPAPVFDENMLAAFSKDDEELEGPAHVDVRAAGWNKIAKATRLDDHRGFGLDEIIRNATISSSCGYHLLTGGLRIAQEAFYDAAREELPFQVWKNFLGGPEEVRFGYLELEMVLPRGERYPYPALSVRGSEGYDVRLALHGITDLRNAVAHFKNDRSASMYDSLLKAVQKLAVVLRDIPRARQARALRDELRSLAMETMQEVKSLELIAVLPFAYDWAVHHEQLFFWSNHGSIFTTAQQCYPDFVQRAAVEWAKTRAAPGQITGRESDLTVL